MQVFKRVNLLANKRAQNLIEFLFVFPILFILTLVIFEVALFWQDANAVYNLNAEINANVAILDYSNLKLTDRCPAAITAFDILKRRDGALFLNDPTYTGNPTILDGEEPFSLYKYTSTSQIAGNPQVSLWVDCRNPFENGITTQIEFYHRTLIFKASIPRYDSPYPIVIIPDNILIASPKLNTIRHY